MPLEAFEHFGGKAFVVESGQSNAILFLNWSSCYAVSVSVYSDFFLGSKY